MNRAIDERILPDSAIVNKGGRRVVALALSADFRRRIVGWMAEQILRKSVTRVADPSRESMVVREGQILVDAVAAAVAYVETHPLRGRPAGMREPAPSARVASRRVVKSSAQRKAG